MLYFPILILRPLGEQTGNSTSHSVDDVFAACHHASPLSLFRNSVSDNDIVLHVYKVACAALHLFGITSRLTIHVHFEAL